MENLIVGIEETEESRAALRFARSFGDATGADVHVIAVLGYEVCDLGDEEYDRIHSAHFDQVMSMADEELGDDYVQHRVTDLSAAYAIAKLAEELEASAMVIGSCHRGPIGRLALGDTGTTLASGSPCPVIVAPRGYGKGTRPRFFRIGVAYNGTPESEVALREATEIARRMDGQLHLIGVIPRLLSPARIGGTDRGYERLLKQEMDSRLEAAAKIHDVETDDVELRVGHTADELAEASADLDLLVIGSRSYGPLGRVLLGGVANKLMRSAACPVVVIPRRSVVTNGESDILATLFSSRPRADRQR